MAELTQVQILYLQALKDSKKNSGELTTIVRDRLSQLKGGSSPTGATGRAQAVLDELEKDGYITVIEKKLFGGKKYSLTEKGKQVIG